MATITLLEDIPEDAYIANYFCANVIEKRYECNTELVYKKNGGFGLNYRYCKKCYDKWNNDKKLNPNIKTNFQLKNTLERGVCYLKLPKTN